MPRPLLFAVAGALIAAPALMVAPAIAQESPPPLPAAPSTGGIGTVPAQPRPLTEEQKVAIVQAVRQNRRDVKVPPGVQPQVGAELPASMELLMLPDRALADIPEAKPYRYTVVEDRVVLVDPTNMRVVEVLAK
ncbi:hypothetical protein J2S22_001007 [Rhodoplanes tepidamans]|uniref:DUF1236 domain-containing protein n=1 Tax=Rhodoplanes tepidamans TaxID=200616 RepID=A0ABT5J9L1_RHOTP|nr:MULTISPECIES: DUF1236 domain-containing protein [Rhodoplanes]MDC7786346.1 DUF1236 domain-containing protein [Rhodoplanes tepidamans]MDQ0354090.1 hypothetical protein [Rhodoplanes tepidamans]